MSFVIQGLRFFLWFSLILSLGKHSLYKEAPSATHLNMKNMHKKYVQMSKHMYKKPRHFFFFKQPLQVKIKISLSIKRKSFLQCSCKSKSWHLVSISSTLLCYFSMNSIEGCPMQKLFFDTKLFGSNPNDLQISRNTIWENDLCIDSDFLNKFLLYFLHSSFFIIENN